MRRENGPVKSSAQQVSMCHIDMPRQTRIFSSKWDDDLFSRAIYYRYGMAFSQPGYQAYLKLKMRSEANGRAVACFSNFVWADI